MEPSAQADCTYVPDQALGQHVIRFSPKIIFHSDRAIKFGDLHHFISYHDFVVKFIAAIKLKLRNSR